ncbi:hypothetical protein RA280_43715 [Cupriavidus sp. CV2]|nr:hypothetical protein [Cupriavidus sp. CV2]
MNVLLVLRQFLVQLDAICALGKISGFAAMECEGSPSIMQPPRRHFAVNVATQG